ncbi:MAG: LytTR family transcriptional regulator, partial [Clostridia bacterium]|nr:LytTR family transcriptional regulator [Clostridia bacterium]
MKIEVKIDAACEETKVVIYTNRATDEIQNLARRLSQDAPQVIVGFLEDEAVILSQEQMIRVFAEGGKVFAETDSGKYLLRLRLYEAEERLDSKHFVRISNAEIINLGMVRGFDLSFAGTICVRMKNEAVTYVSRRYVSKIKQVLG